MRFVAKRILDLLNKMIEHGALNKLMIEAIKMSSVVIQADLESLRHILSGLNKVVFIIGLAMLKELVE